MLHSPIDHDRVAMYLWPNDPADDGNALAGVRNAILIEGAIVALIAPVVLLLYWLF